MKKTKIIVPALGMLLLSTAASVTGTVAWFSANTTVSATGANVKVKSDAATLLISKDKNTAAEIQAENGGKGYYTVSLANAQPIELLPVAHNEAAGDGTTDFTWYTMSSADPTDYTGVASTKAEVTNANLSKYALKYSLYFTVAVGSNDVTGLKVTSVTMGGDTSVRCLVKGAANSVEYSASTAAEYTGSSVLFGDITPTTVGTVDIYIFYDGNAQNIYTTNLNNIANTTVGLTFSASVKAAA